MASAERFTLVFVGHTCRDEATIFAVEIGSETLMVTSAKLLFEQTPFVIVHLKIYAPAISEFIAEVGEFILIIFACAGPSTCIHVPVPAPALLAASVPDVPQIFCVAPAVAVGRAELTVIFTVSLEAQLNLLKSRQMNMNQPLN
jgi:hypothetical protein